MADKTIKHFVFIRFFPWQDSNYPHDIFDVDFLSKQLDLATNHILSSLNNQTNKNFEIVFFANAKYFDDPKYDFIFSTLKEATSLPVRFIKMPQAPKCGEGGSFSLYDQTEMPALVKDALNKYDFVIQTRMDFDDFIFKDAVADTQSKVNDCDNILLYGYCKGYTYILGELYNHDSLWRGKGHNSMFQSLILKSSATKDMPFVNINKFYHDIFKDMLKDFLGKNGIEFSERMFQQNTSIRAYIYFRHEFSHWLSYHKKWPLKTPEEGRLTASDITKKKLAEEFACHLPLNSIKDEECGSSQDLPAIKHKEGKVMTDKTIKHFIFMRFFTWQDPKYPHDVLDVDFLSKQLIVVKNNALKTLENQSNKNFELVFLLNEKVVDNPKYKFISETLQNATTLPLKFIKRNEQSLLVKDALNEYDFVIQSRMDFDDFIFKDAVADTQSKINECENILSYGYCNGYEYIHGELYVYDIKWRGIGHLSILQSLILKSSFAKKIPFTGPYSYVHTKIKLGLKEFLEKNGLEFSESMFQQNLSTKAYIYFRSEFSHSILTSNAGNPIIKVPNRPKITDITAKHLKSEFGFHYDLKFIKDEADFNYDFKSTAEEFGSRQDLTAIKWD